MPSWNISLFESQQQAIESPQKGFALPEFEEQGLLFRNSQSGEDLEQSGSSIANNIGSTDSEPSWSKISEIIGSASSVLKKLFESFNWSWLIIIWTMGSLYILSLFMTRLIRSWILVKHAEPLQNNTFNRLITGCFNRFGVSKTVKLLQSESITVPLMWGYFNPSIVLPKEAEKWPETRIEIVLLHEAAHIKRADFLSTLIAHTASVFYWCIPLIWVALRRFHIERENACDDYVLSSGTKPTVYARNLFEVAQAVESMKWASHLGLAIVRKNKLEGRVMEILNSTKQRSVLKPATMLLVGLLAVSLLIPVSSIQTRAQKESTLVPSEAYDEHQGIVVRQVWEDQIEAVNEARTRLAALTSPDRIPGLVTIDKESSDIIIRKIEFDEVGRSHQARLSPDGKKILYIHVHDKEPPHSISVMDLSSGKSQHLVEGVHVGGQNIFEWSPDGKKVVYTSRGRELCVIGADGGKSEVLWQSPDEETNVYPLDWSRDNRFILTYILSAEVPSQMAIIPAEGGEPLPIVTGGIYGHGQFSPDGKFIVGQKNNDIHIWSIDGTQEVCLDNNPAGDNLPLWSSDGNYIVFISDRAKTTDLWVIPVSGASQEGAPVCIKRNIGKNTLLTDITPDGQMTMVVLALQITELLVLQVDPSSGEALGDFRPFAKYPTQHFLPRWSPDGMRIAYTSRKGDFVVPRIFISSGSEKEDLEIPKPNYAAANVEWARDGKHLIFPGFNQDQEEAGIFQVSLENYEIKPLHLGERLGKGFKGAFVNLQWLPKVNLFMFEKRIEMYQIEIYTMDKDGQNVQLVSEGIPAEYWTSPSPDGRHVACRGEQNLNIWSLAKDTSVNIAQFHMENVEGIAWSPDGKNVVWNDNRKLTVFSVDDGKSTTLVEAGQEEEITGYGWFQAWSPDGKKIAYVLRNISAGANALAELWAVPSAGGTPQKIAVAPEDYPVLSDVVWHKNGNMIFVTGRSMPDEGIWYEHWVMENFLPEIKK